MLTSLLMGLAVGAAGGVPVGPMGALAMEQGLAPRAGETAAEHTGARGLGSGARAALGTGLGAALGMAGWGFVGAALVSRAGPFIKEYERPLQILVAFLFLFIAFSGWRRLKDTSNGASGGTGFTPAFLKASLISALRPTTALIVAGLLSSFFPERTVDHPAVFACAAFLANLAWFLVLIVAARVIVTRVSLRAVGILRAALVAIIGLFGCGLLLRALV